MTSLRNKSRHSQVLVLDHPVFATRANGWQRATAQFASANEDGVRTVSDVRRTYAGSLTIAPGETIEGLHPAIAGCSQVPALVRAGILVLSEEEKSDEKPKPEANRAEVENVRQRTSGTKPLSKEDR